MVQMVIPLKMLILLFGILIIPGIRLDFNGSAKISRKIILFIFFLEGHESKTIAKIQQTLLHQTIIYFWQKAVSDFVSEGCQLDGGRI